MQCAGYGYRLKTAVLKREFAQGGMLQHLALLYTQALIRQMAQTAKALDLTIPASLLISADRMIE